MSNFMELVKNRRSIYNISNEEIVSKDKIKKIVESAILDVPSAYNSQSSRVILLFGDDHIKLWDDIVLNTLKSKVKPENFSKTQEKINTFTAGYASILFFEDQSVIKKLQEDFIAYAENFPIWSLQSAGMLQFAIWTALSNEGLGASLQHYNPIIDEKVKKHGMYQMSGNYGLKCQLVSL